MKYLCGFAAVCLLVVFSAVNLFLPYAVVALALVVGLAAACGIIKRRSGTECPLGFC